MAPLLDNAELVCKDCRGYHIDLVSSLTVPSVRNARMRRFLPLNSAVRGPFVPPFFTILWLCAVLLHDAQALEATEPRMQRKSLPPNKDGAHRTVRHPGIGTGISEASKRVPIFFLCYPGLQASEFLFSTEELGPSPRGSDPVPCRLT